MTDSYAPTSKQHLLDRLRKLSWLSPEQICAIGEASRAIDVKRGAPIYREQDHSDLVYVMLSGMGALWMVEGDRRVLMSIIGPGDIMGISALLADGPRPFRCEGLSDCKVAALPAASFRSVVFDEPKTFEKGLQATFGRWEMLLKRYAQFMTLSAKGRLAMALLELSDRFGVNNSRGRLLPFLVSHAMLATMVGASRQHVTMQLVDFEREQTVMRENRRLVVIPERLRASMD
jgi:CRP-like cAMP-binding protein